VVFAISVLIYTALQAIYPEHHWSPEKFKRHPAHYWNDLNNQRQYLDSIYDKLQLKSTADWLYVTSDQIIANHGAGLLTQYGGSLQKGKHYIMFHLLIL
jgi:hypothetical protein